MAVIYKPHVVLDEKYTEVFSDPTLEKLIRNHYQSMKEDAHDAGLVADLREEQRYITACFKRLKRGGSREMHFGPGSYNIDAQLHLCRLLAECVEPKVEESKNLWALAETQDESIVAIHVFEQWPRLLNDLRETARQIKKLRWELLEAPSEKRFP